MLSFIHLSDIHFQKYSGDAYDIDKDIRQEIINDIDENLHNYISNIDGILVCGDIAFSGAEQEYKAAIAFLDELCDVLHLDKKHIFCVPGNHDVDQSLTGRSLLIQALQKNLEEKSSTDEFDSALGGFLRIPSEAKVLYSSISNYNQKFAAQYGCGFGPDKLMWEKSMDLDDKYTLCIVGINSTILSSHTDHSNDEPTKEKKMRIGAIQIPNRHSNTVYLSLCHHPPECWNDPNQEVLRKLSDRAFVQLYGHKHEQAIEHFGKALLIKSGATQPSRFEEGWFPIYNWISLDIEQEEENDFLLVRIYPRVLNKNRSSFISGVEGKKKYYDHHIPLTQGGAELGDTQPVTSPIATDESEMSPPLDMASWEHDFIYDFINLPHVRQSRVLKKLQLTEPTDKGKTYIELIDKIIQRAKKLGCVQSLIDETKLQKAEVNND